MQKSLFTKYFALCSSIILGSMAILGAVLLIFASQYFKLERQRLLLRNAMGAANITVAEYITRGDDSIRKNVVLSGFSMLASAVDATIYLTDNSGRTLVCTEGENCVHAGFLIPDNILQKAREKGMYNELGTLGGIYATDFYTVALPVQVESVGQIGYIFASSSAGALRLFLVEILRMFTLSAVFVLLISFVVLYFVTRQMIRPLREMAAAAKNFGKGDFTRRVPVRRYDEIGQLSIAFNNMASSLATTESMRRSFTANVSHELKTPMTTIGGFIDGILDGTIPPEKRDHYLNIVSQEVKRLARLVRSMLDISKIEAGEMNIKLADFDINEIVCRTVFAFEQRIEEKHLDIRGLDVGKVIVCADADMLHQVVYNLIDNAVKFANDGGYIEVNYKTENNVTLVAIRNSGAGISKEEAKNVFDRFYKTDKSRSLDKQGVGLGLYIVKTIINMHGGDIIINSTQGEFCEFVFSIPSSTQSKKEQKKLQQKQ